MAADKARNAENESRFEVAGIMTYASGESRNSEDGVDYILIPLENDDGEKEELYAECPNWADEWLGDAASAGFLRGKIAEDAQRKGLEYVLEDKEVADWLAGLGFDEEFPDILFQEERFAAQDVETTGKAVGEDVYRIDRLEITIGHDEGIALIEGIREVE